jgi:hypothetical protein
MRTEYPTIKKGPGGVWYVWYDRHTKRSLKTTNERKAKQALATIRTKLREEGFFIPSKNARLSYFIEEYLKARKAEVEPNTYHLDEVGLESFIKAVGDKRMTQIGNKDVSLFHWWCKQPKPKRLRNGKFKLVVARNTTINAYDRHLRHAFSVAQGWGYIKTHPYEDLSRPGKKVRFLPETPRPFREMTEEEIKNKLLPAIRELDFRLMIQMYLLCAGRGEELCNAHRDWISEKEVKLRDGTVQKMAFHNLSEDQNSQPTQLPP